MEKIPVNTNSKKKPDLDKTPRTYNIRTKRNYDANEQLYEWSPLPSLTIPDQALTMSEIMSRFAQGLPVHGEKVPVYNGDEELPDFQRMDLADKQEYLELNAAYVEEIKQRLLEQKAQEQKEKDEKRKAKYRDQEIPFEEVDQEPDNPIPTEKPSKKQKDKQNPSPFE